MGVRRAITWVAGPFAVLAAALAFPAALEAAANFNGVASCANSTCHGRAEGNGEVVRQDEIATWQDPSAPSGAHSRAFDALLSDRGQQILASLGFTRQDRDEYCLGCHATRAGSRGARFYDEDGVGCESCHGASGAWVAGHYKRNTSHALNLGNGLRKLEDPQVRARLCLDCHYGDDERGYFVTHRMMAAGHPRMSFELDLFSALQQHHDEDGDYVARKGRLDSVQLWAVGQAEAVRRSSELFADPMLGTEGMFPQFYFYDCHSCHRAIVDGPERRLTFESNPGRDIPFGNPPFNDENMIMLSAVSRVLAPAEAAGFDAASRAFHGAMRDSRAKAVAAAGQLGQRAGALSDALAGKRYDSDVAFTVIAAIADRTTSPRFTDYAGSAQAVMAVDTLLNALVRDGRVTVGAAAGIRADIARAYAAVRTPEGYRPRDFRAALGGAARAIGALK